ncbi:MAG: GNAT family N-acetyltransferase [Acidithiobacillus sp.]|jgi:ribosomal protein S18 acetylase RimI-like enzyme|uniref:GNAT family N-acetyltransferase n=1 Tax=Acidithiobacillus sp. TaxID=1872118 RepID=UPI00355E15B2
MRKKIFRELNIYNCQDDPDFDYENGNCTDVINDLYNIANMTKIRFNSQEEPFDAIIMDNQIIAGSMINEKEHPNFSFSIAVHPNYQKKGIGKKLIQNAIQYAKQNEFQSIRLDVVNENLHNYLDQLGFEYKGMRIFEKKI